MMSNKGPIRNIIFDLGGVLLNLDYPKLMQGLDNVGIKNVPLAHDLKILADYETGHITTDQFLTNLMGISIPGTRNEDLSKIWNSILLDFPVQRINLLKELRKHYRIFLLSNINELHAEAFESQFLSDHPTEDFHGLFEKVYYSCRISRRKPDPDIYRYVLDDSNLIASETAFIDDVKENVESARKVGINARYLDLQNGEKTEQLFDAEFRLRF